MGDRRASTVVSPSLLRSTTPAPPSGWVPDMRDPLDAEVMRIVRVQPLRIYVDRLDGPQATQARYTFAMGDAPAGKPVMCRTVTRAVRGVETTKVLAKNDSGWTQLDLFLLGLQATSALAS